MLTHAVLYLNFYSGGAVALLIDGLMVTSRTEGISRLSSSLAPLPACRSRRKEDRMNMLQYAIVNDRLVLAPSRISVKSTRCSESRRSLHTSGQAKFKAITRSGVFMWRRRGAQSMDMFQSLPLLVSLLRS